MEIRKTQKGWEYDGILFKDKRSALLAREATENEKSSRIPATDKNDFTLVFDGEHALSFGIFIEDVLRVQDKSIVKLAAEIGVSKQALFDWMNAKSLPSRKNLESIIFVTQRPAKELHLALRDNFKMQEKKLFNGLFDIKEA